MKILWHSNAPWVPSGYGQQTALVTRQLRNAGHDVAISAFSGLAGGSIPWGGMPVYPRQYDTYGNDVIPDYATTHFGGDPLGGLVVTLIDVWVFNNPEFSKLPLASWTPIDHHGLSEAIVRYFKGTGAVPVAMSRHGERELKEAGFSPLYVPHGIDTSVFAPMDDRSAVREALGLPADAFVVFANMANQDKVRKGWIEQLQGFAKFRETHDDAVLYLHTHMGPERGGLDLYRFLDELGVPDEAVVWTDQHAYRMGMSTEYLRAAYSAADVTLNASCGEGFGIPIIESQACGTPTIVTDASAMTELAGAGWAVEGDRFWEPNLEAWWYRPRIDAIADALGSAYEEAGNLRDAAREFALQYDTDAVFEAYWKPALKVLERAVEIRRETK